MILNGFSFIDVVATHVAMTTRWIDCWSNYRKMDSYEEETQLIRQTRLCQLDELATARWLLHHQAVVQLSLKAVTQTAQLREETVYAKLMEAEKVSLLVYDVILIEIWREQVLPHLLKTADSPPPSPLLIYTVLYHEGAAISLLELLLYHSAACEALGDSIVDLIDYCHRTLLRSTSNSSSLLADSPVLKHLDISHLEANIAIRCIAILRFLAGHADNLSEIVTSRMLTTTDVPLLAVQLMEQQPWIRRDGGEFEIYDNGQWRRRSSGGASGQLHPVAAHLWLLLLSLLMNPVAPRKYQLDNFRCQQLLKLRSSLNPMVIDQIPPLADFERWLIQLSVVGGAQQVWRTSTKQKPFILELVAEMRQVLLKQLASNWTIILERQRQSLIIDDQSDESIQRLAAIYEPEHLESTLAACCAANKNLATTATMCKVCDKQAIHRCSRCRRQHYCSKECQVADWPRHKSDCKA